jgi:putative RNA 2'-phosphotransferase
MTNGKPLIKISKFLSLVLRHKPEQIGIELDNNGWTSVDELISKMNSNGKSIDFETLELVVDTNNKKRFCFNSDKTQIRANQGHSIDIDLGYTAKTPPALLYHGTADRYTDSIYKQGIQKRDRHHVHLSSVIETALSVGKRHGKPVIFEIDTEPMINNGHIFYESENGVWLTDEVPAQYIKVR